VRKNPFRVLLSEAKDQRPINNNRCFTTFKMKYCEVFSFSTLILLVLLWTGIAAAQSVGIVAGAGRAPIRAGNIAGARQEAVRQAKRAAMEAAVAMAVLPVESVEKRKHIEKAILAEPGRFILSYEVNRDRENEGFYEIAIEAKVDMDRLGKTIRGLSVEKPPEMSPGGELLVMIVFEKGDKKGRFEELEKELASRFEMAGLKPAAASASDAIFKSAAVDEALKARFEAMAGVGETFSIGRLLFGIGEADHPADACPNLVQLFFVDLKRRDVLMKFAYKLKDGLSCNAAAKEAAPEIYSRLAEGIAGKGILDRAGRATVLVGVSGVKEYTDIRRIHGAVGEIPGVKKVAMESFAAGGEVRFRVEFEGRPEDLSAAIVKIENKDFKLRQAPGPADRLSFKAVY
jgi:hypothetical protein